MRGDHVYYNCSTYTHHGIDCGDGTVIHYNKNNAMVSRISWANFASTKTVFVKEYGLHDRPDIVVLRAEGRLEEDAYDLCGNNCEHFATWCKTGKHASQQVKNAAAVGIGASGSGAAVAGSLGVVSAAEAAAGLSGAGIMSGLATVGGVVGGGAVAGIGALGLGPTAITKMAMDQVLKDDKNLTHNEREARAGGRIMTNVGAVVGTGGAITAVAINGSVAGLSGAGITSGLAAVGSTVGGGMAAGVLVTVAAPAAAAAAVGYGAYKLLKWILD